MCEWAARALGAASFVAIGDALLPLAKHNRSLLAPSRLLWVLKAFFAQERLSLLPRNIHLSATAQAPPPSFVS
jgi:hypothetical protein